MAKLGQLLPKHDPSLIDWNAPIPAVRAAVRMPGVLKLLRQHRQLAIPAYVKHSSARFVPMAQWCGAAMKKLPSALAVAAALSHTANSSPDRRARACCSREAARIGSISGIAETCCGKKCRSMRPAAQNRR